MDSKTKEFEAARSRLIGLAYRLLGSMSDAQDAVQDTYIKWVTCEDSIDIPLAWLTRVCTNHCLDQLQSAHHKRVDYIGQWLPEPIEVEFVVSIDEQIDMAASLTTAFLLLLERLTPKERAAYVLHNIFAIPFNEVAIILELQPANCRKLATRAREHVTKNNVRYIPTESRQQELLQSFEHAIETGDTSALSTMLRVDSDLRADSGGKVRAVVEVLQGQKTIFMFISNVLSEPWSKLHINQRIINGTLGLLIENKDKIYATITFGYDANDQVKHIYIMRHPDKLAPFAQSKWVADNFGHLIID